MIVRVLCFLAVVLAAGPAVAKDRVQVVASFSILADFVRNVGGDRVAVAVLVGPGGDSHVFTPAPADAHKVAAADLVIVNGLGLEGWLPRLVQSSGSGAKIVAATTGVVPRRLGADADPHAWQSVPNAKIYVVNIRDALIAADGAGAELYRGNADAYLARLDALDREVRAQVAAIPPEQRKVITTHDAFGYFADAYGIAFVAPQGVSTDTEVSARDLARLITQIRTEHIPAVFLENAIDPRLIDRVAAETGAAIGGTLYSDSLTAENGPAPTYIDMVSHNIKTLTGALKP